ncbi:hypothetical protein ABGB19_15170 [Mycobacterium sp. B14F4]|uniref:hypothetical protein n=1 Tax=Mycobacterium sp. B14F4 TaxID=3153565 RepID=UPI00325E731F
MKRLVAAGFLLVVGVELIALLGRDRQLILIFSGVAVALALLGVRWYLIRETEPVAEQTPSDDAAKGLQRWLSRTETLIGHSETTRRDWDRHLRPMLARQFEMATGQKRIKDRTSYHATGRMLFGAELWDWVNPENVARSGADQPGPGRGALDEILQRLERV